MGVINVRLAVGALLGAAVLVGAGTAVVRQHQATVQSDATQAVPAANVPGYTGPVYNSDGKLVGYAQPDGTTTNESSPAEDPRGRDMNSAPYPAPAANAPMAEPAAPVVRSAPAPVHRSRSTRKSVAIVAGSAGAGAAIGALAGGGKGAGIGALSGGAAGFVYDRMTHNK